MFTTLIPILEWENEIITPTTILFENLQGKYS